MVFDSVLFFESPKIASNRTLANDRYGYLPTFYQRLKTPKVSHSVISVQEVKLTKPFETCAGIGGNLIFYVL